MPPPKVLRHIRKAEARSSVPPLTSLSGVAALSPVVEGGHALDEHAGIGMLRATEEVPNRSILDDDAVLHDDDPVDHLRHETHVMPDHDQAAAHLLLDAAEGLHDLTLGDHVERAGGLVGDDQSRLHRDGDGDAGALLHAA